MTLIFDLDGTLLDTLGDLHAAVNHALQEHGMPTHSVEEVRWMVGNGVRLLMQRAVPEGTDEALFERVFASFRTYYAQHNLDTTRPYDGIPELLNELHRRGIPMAVVSNKMDSATRPLVQRFFGQWIDVAIGEREGMRRKPAPDMVHEAIRLLGVHQVHQVRQVHQVHQVHQVRQVHQVHQVHQVRQVHQGCPEEYIYVGDSDVDIQTAQAAALPCLSVLWGFRDREFLTAHGATQFVQTPAEILSLIP